MEQPMRGGRDNGRTAQHAPPGAKTKAAPKGPAFGLVFIGALVLVVAGALVFWQGGGGRSGGGQNSAAASIGGPFHMLDQNGGPVDQSLLKGKWTAVFFGYTYCPDVCPATLQALGGAYRKLGKRGDDFQTVFVSIDPDRDHPSQMKAYLDAQALPMKTLGLTGTPLQTATIAKAYRIYYAKSGQGEGYGMDHSAVVYLMDPDGKFAAPLTHDMQPDRIANEILKAQGRL